MFLFLIFSCACIWLPSNLSFECRLIAFQPTTHQFQQRHPRRATTDARFEPPHVHWVSLSVDEDSSRNKPSLLPSGLKPHHRQSVTTSGYQQMFSKRTKAIVWGMQTRAVQSMLDFDFICRCVHCITIHQKHINEKLIVYLGATSLPL